MYLKSYTLILADVFENFRKMCQLDPAKLISFPGSAWQAALKKTEIELELLTDIDMLLMVEKGIREGYATLLINMQKHIWNEHMKKYNKNKESSYLKY